MAPIVKPNVASGPTRQGVRQLMRYLSRQQQRQARQTARATTNAAAAASGGADVRPRPDAPGEINAETMNELRACRDRASALLIHPATGSEKPSSSTSAVREDGHAHAATTATASSSPPSSASATSRAGCFSQVISEDHIRTVEGDTDNTLCGLTAAVSDVLRVQEFTSSEPSVLRQLSGRKELPLVSWLRRHGALIVAEVASETPFSIREGTCFGPQERNAQAIVSGACHFSFSSSLLGPPALNSCVAQDVVGFKPTAQTFGTFTDDFKMPISAMTVGITAGTVDDLLYLWQNYTGAIDETVLGTTGQNDASSLVSDEPSDSTSGPAIAGGAGAAETTASGASSVGSRELSTAAAALQDAGGRGGPGDAPGTTSEPHIAARSREAHVYANPNILDHSPANYTIQPEASESSSASAAAMDKGEAQGMPKGGRRISYHLQPKAQKGTQLHDAFGTASEFQALQPHGHTRWSPKRQQGNLADIDVGWKDYNASVMRESYRRTPSTPGWWRHVIFGSRPDVEDEPAESPEVKSASWLPWRKSTATQKTDNAADTSGQPLVEITVGYPFEWLDGPCRARYGGAEAFRAQLARMVYTRSALHKDRKMEIVPLAIDVDLQEVWQAVQVISRYETARAFERLLPAQLVRLQQAQQAPQRLEEERLVEAMLKAQASAKATSGSPAGGTDGTTTPSSAQQQPPPPPQASIASAPTSPTLALMTSVLQELPPEVLRLLDEGQRVPLYAYHRALRTRDEVVRVTEDHFQDVDMLIVPLLSEPFQSGDLKSILPVLPFHLAGNPMVSLQLTEKMPIALVEQPGRDAALLEDAYRFVQFVRGSSPRWWQSGGVSAPASAPSFPASS